jgi:hypothetical protein
VKELAVKFVMSSILTLAETGMFTDLARCGEIHGVFRGMKRVGSKDASLWKDSMLKFSIVVTIEDPATSPVSAS